MGLVRSAGNIAVLGVVGIVLAGVASSISPESFSISSVKDLISNPTLLSNLSKKTISDLTPPPAGGLAPTQIRVGVPQPGAGSDQLFVLSLPDKTLRQQSVIQGWRVSTPSLTDSKPPNVKLESDQTTVLEKEDGTKQPLKTEKGDPYKDVVVLGMWDAEKVAALARDDQRRLLSVSNDGSIRQVAMIPENFQPIFVSNGSVWFVKSNADPNRPACPVGPSSLIRIDETGTQSTIVSDARIIVSAVDGPSGAIAYAFDSGDMEARSGSHKWSGKGKPLAWADASHLVISQGSKMMLLDLSTNSLTDAGALPQVPLMAARVVQ